MGQSLIRVATHLVWSTKHRQPLIDEAIEPELYAYLGGVCNEMDCQSIIVGGYQNHVHVLCLLSKKVALMDLLEEVTYPIAMHEIIDNRLRKNEPLINNLFVQTDQRRGTNDRRTATKQVETSEILSIKSGFGFIKYPPNNLFFHYTSLVDADFNELKEGDKVEFIVGRREDGQEVATQVRLLK
ncbi:MAG: cold shock domain-containing protein [Chitinophagaceae bacterium]|nr:cold shock domain-containing protein [Chitinophagaceae bacterium]